MASVGDESEQGQPGVGRLFIIGALACIVAGSVGLGYGCQYTGGKRAAIDDYAAARRAGQDTAAPLFADDDTRATDAWVAKSTRHSVYNYHSRFVGGQSRACFSTVFFTPDGLRWIDVLLLEVPDGWRVASLSEERDCECKPKTNQPCAMVP